MDSCQDILDAMAKRFDDWDKGMSLIIEANRELKLAEAKLRRQVHSARRTGHPWASIGFALGVSRQAAQQRFAESENDEGWLA